MVVSSTGRLTLPDLEGPPVIELEQFSHSADRSGLVDVARDAVRVLATPAMQEVVRRVAVDEYGTSLESIGDDPVRFTDWVLSASRGLYHVSSTCREGVVTDPFGRLLGYEGVYICDASLFPRVPPRNPYLPVVQLAERLTARWRSEKR
jgi:choline dehydrogenase-like flavoprotein